MPPYVVAYDLVKEKDGHDYQPLWDELKRLKGQKTQYSVWLVAASNTAREVHDHIKQFIDSNDRLWVTELTKNHYFSNAMAGTNKWIENNPPQR